MYVWIYVGILDLCSKPRNSSSHGRFSIIWLFSPSCLDIREAKIYILFSRIQFSAFLHNFCMFAFHSLMDIRCMDSLKSVSDLTSSPLSQLSLTFNSLMLLNNVCYIFISPCRYLLSSETFEASCTGKFIFFFLLNWYLCQYLIAISLFGFSILI